MKLIFDGLNIAFRAHYVFDKQQGLSQKEGVPTGTIYGFLNILFGWRNDYPDHELIIAWDGPEGSTERKNLYAGYKAGRSSSKDVVKISKENIPSEVDGFGLQLWILKNILKDAGIKQVEGYSLEADDIIATLSKDTYENDPVVIISSDRDLLQLVDDNTIVQTPNRNNTFDKQAVEEEYGVSPELLPVFRSLIGDSSDGLPGLPYFRKKIAARLVRDHSSLGSIYNSLESEDLTKKELEKLEDFEDQAYLNQKIMRLTPVDSDLYDVTDGKFNESNLDGWCEFLQFKSGTADQMKALKPQGFVRYNDVISRSPD